MRQQEPAHASRLWYNACSTNVPVLTEDTVQPQTCPETWGWRVDLVRLVTPVHLVDAEGHILTLAAPLYRPTSTLDVGACTRSRGTDSRLHWLCTGVPQQPRGAQVRQVQQAMPVRSDDGSQHLGGCIVTWILTSGGSIRVSNLRNPATVAKLAIRPAPVAGRARRGHVPESHRRIPEHTTRNSVGTEPALC